MPAADPMSARQRLAAAGLLPLFGMLAWSIGLAIAEGRPIAAALLAPWAAPLEAWRLAPGATWPQSLAASGIAALALTLLAAAAVFAPRVAALYGDARFATRREMRKSGLLARRGLILGRTGDAPPAYLRHDGARHVLLTAPTRSGKGVGVVLPNLLSWAGSVVVLDVKNECFAATSGFRAAHGQRIVRFAPGDPTHATHRYNPLDAVRRDPHHRIADLQAIAHLLTPEGAGEQKMWHQEARALFVGLALYILDTPGLPLSFGQVMRILQANTDLPKAFVQLIRERGAQLDPACANILANFAHKAVKEQSGVKSTLTGALELWNDPAIDAATAVSDFSFETLRAEPTTIYVSISLDQLERLAFLLNLFFQQLVGVTARRAPGDDEPYPLLILIDEFAALGRMDLIVDKMPFLAGFNAKLLLVIQGLAQLDRLYGTTGRELILQNAGLQIFFAPNDELTAGYVSNRLGTRTVVQKTRSRSTSAAGSSLTRGRSLHARPLMSPDEVRRLSEDRALIFVESARPVSAAKIVHHMEPAFASRLLPPVDVMPIAVPRPTPFSFGAGPRDKAQATLGPGAAPPRSDAPGETFAKPITARAAMPKPASRAPRRKAAVDAFAQLDFDRLIAADDGRGM